VDYILENFMLVTTKWIDGKLILVTTRWIDDKL